ncbi:Putative resolvase (fragment) [Mesorhizobium plurifarium]|uniref:Putative resolvase n=1 Tax=Mesorhizobium plurifarium TaxID=69974 RepID=A0A090G620_MESPL
MVHIVLTVLGTSSKLRLRFITERGRDGIEQRNSTYKVANSGLTEIIMALLADGLGPAGIAKLVGCCLMQVYRIIQASMNLLLR